MRDGIEEGFLAAVSAERLWTDLTFLAAIDRTSGTPGEHQAMAYIADQLRAAGADVTVHEFDAYLSFPGPASIDVVAAPKSWTGGSSVPTKTRSFSANTSDDGLVAELIYVPGGSDMFRDTESQKRLAAADIKGKFVVSEAGSRHNMLTAAQHGAAGYVHAWPSDEDALHEGIVTPIWGTPTPETIDTIPKIPVVTISHNPGKALIAALRDGPVKIRLRARSETGWRRVQLVTGDIRGSGPEFVMLSGHVDSWYLGATDNATGNATCLEVARVFAKQRASLRRGLRVCFWPGHSTGRYAGSAWYADNHWQELHDRCVAHLNCDSTGPLGATEYDEVMATAETFPIGKAVIGELTGQNPAMERPVRAGDQSFWGIGVPTLFMLLSSRPTDQRAKVGGSGYGWWWHTEADTIDKADRGILHLDTKIYALSALRLCRDAVLPLSVSAVAAEIAGIVEGMNAKAAGRFDLTAVEREVARLREAARALDERSPALAKDATRAEAASRAIHRAVRALIPINYTQASAFDHDMAVPMLPLPGLQAIAKLATLPDGSDDAGFLRTRLVRERNRVVHALREAVAALEG